MGGVSISLDDLPLRDHLRGMTPYGAPQAALPVALNVNENTHPVPQEVADDILDAVALALRDVNRYPDREFTELREGFADYLGYGLTREQIWAANGSNEVLQHVLQAFGGPGRTAFGFAPTYSMYPLLTQATGASWTAGTRAADFSVDAESAAAQVADAEPDVVFLCAPNNPTGTPMTLEVIEAVYDATDGHRRRRRGVPGVRAPRRRLGPRAAAGTRASGGLAHDEQGVRVRRCARRLPRRGRRSRRCTASRAPAVPLELADPGGRARRRSATPRRCSGWSTRSSRSATASRPPSRRSATSRTSRGPTSCCSAGSHDAAATWRGLYDKGVLIRDVGIPQHLRVTAGTEQETTAFLDALASLDSAS